MFVQINHYFSPFVKLLSASRTKPKSPLPRQIFQCLWKKKLFLPKPLKRWLCRPVSRREIVRQTPQTGEVVVQSCAQRSATCVDVCRGAAVEDRKCTTGDPAKSEFLISNHFILRCSDNDALPHLTPGTNGFLHNLQWQLLKSIASAALVTLLWGRWSVAAL